ncbi:MAG: AAA family ATPase [Chloroflexota bacterium]|nr:AAA family ATPase [Chloroflexota bacterium]
MQDGDKAIAPLLEALKFSPTNIPLRKHIAELLVESGRNAEAVEQFKAILDLAEDYDTTVKLGRAYYSLGEFQLARSVLQKVQQEKSSAEVYLLLSKVCFALEDYQAAGDYYEEALDADPEIEDPDYQQELSARNVKVKGKLRVLNFGGPHIQDDIVERPTITFSDVGGLEELKESIKMNIIYPFQNPDLFRKFGKKVGGGILMYGPPGCGKTFLARATAGECRARFINIAIHDILDMYIGNSEKNLHKIFELARKHRPTIIFIDELDAIGGSRQQMRYQHNRMLTNQLLTELDGAETNNHEILVLGATNSPWFVDSSLRRPGRFDRVLFVPPPDLQARAEILQIHLREKPIEAVDYLKVAKNMEKYSGADIQGVCETAADTVIQEAMKTGKIRPIRTDDLLNALKKTRPTILEWLSTAKNYATYSNEGGAYDDILKFLQKG